jgi:hypothetical protein
MPDLLRDASLHSSQFFSRPDANLKTRAILFLKTGADVTLIAISAIVFSNRQARDFYSSINS